MSPPDRLYAVFRPRQFLLLTGGGDRKTAEMGFAPAAGGCPLPSSFFAQADSGTVENATRRSPADWHVQRDFYALRDAGLLELINHILVMFHREQEGREASPLAVGSHGRGIDRHLLRRPGRKSMIRATHAPLVAQRTQWS
jgi:hypothetical protein